MFARCRCCSDAAIPTLPLGRLPRAYIEAQHFAAVQAPLFGGAFFPPSDPQGPKQATAGLVPALPALAPLLCQAASTAAHCKTEVAVLLAVSCCAAPTRNDQGQSRCWVAPIG